MEFSLNDVVCVDLTPTGRSIYENFYNNMAGLPEEALPIFMSKIRTGTLEIQLWHLFEIFGNHIGMCCDVPFNNCIIELKE